MTVRERTQEQMYRHRHYTVRRVCGKASNYSCIDCGDTAKDWSTIHGEDNYESPWGFEPRCRRCHSEYDKTEEARERSEAKAAHTEALLNNEALLSANFRKRILTILGSELLKEEEA